MLAIEVEYLMGRAIATRIDERNLAEWPPHPQRLFSALVATQAELDLGEPGRAALAWLETLPPPTIAAEPNPAYRQVAEYFVPVNDEALHSGKSKIDFRHPLERRNRQLRYFPAVVLADPIVQFQWAVDDTSHRPALQALVENLSYLGHSASPVRACLRSEASAPTWVPDDDGSEELRVPRPGRLKRLEAAHQLRLIDESAQPPPGVPARYARPGTPTSVFSPRALVLAFGDGPRFSLDATQPLLSKLRAMMLSLLDIDIPTVLSGHEADGAPARDAHLALAPLAFVEHRHADGALKGAALILPRTADAAVRRRLSALFAVPRKLQLGSLGALSLRLLTDSAPELRALQFETQYAAAAAVWASVTPMVLDRHPKARGPSAETIIAESCHRIGLPTPAEIRLGPVSAFAGAAPVFQHQAQGKQTKGRLLQHVLIRFPEPVHGPILLGAGRHLGLGLLRPLRQGGRP
jgi:CRISPR-associated protein Csb2